MDPIELLIRLARKILWNEPFDEQEEAVRERNLQLFNDAYSGALRLIKRYGDTYVKSIKESMAVKNSNLRTKFKEQYGHDPVDRTVYWFPFTPTADETIEDTVSQIFGPRRVDDKTGQGIIEPAKITPYGKTIITTKALADLDALFKRGNPWNQTTERKKAVAQAIAISGQVYTTEEQALLALFTTTFGRSPDANDWETVLVPTLTDSNIDPNRFTLTGSRFPSAYFQQARLFKNLWQWGQPTARDPQSYFDAFYSAVHAYALANGIEAKDLLDNKALLAQLITNYEKVSAVNRQLIRSGDRPLSLTFEEYLASVLSSFAPTIDGKAQPTIGFPDAGSSARFLDTAEAARKKALDSINEANAATKGVAAYLATLGLDKADIDNALEVFAPTVGFTKSPWSSSEGLNAYRQRVFDFITRLQKGLALGGTKRDVGELFTNLSVAGAFLPEFSAPFFAGTIDPSVPFTNAQREYQQAGLPLLTPEKVELLHQQANAMEIRQAKEAKFGTPSRAIDNRIMAFAATLPIEEQQPAIALLSRELLSLYQATRAKGLETPGEPSIVPPGRQIINFPANASQEFIQQQTQSALKATGAESQLTGTELTTAAQKQGITTTGGPGFAEAFTFELFAGSQDLSALYQKTRPRIVEQIQKVAQPQRGSFLPLVRI